jgi:hypothetical protein
MWNREEQIDVANAMESYGGSFVAALGKALQRADSINAEKIKDAFPEYWKQYAEKGKADREGSKA